MPNCTIHELFTSMNAAASALDYRQKEQNEWTTWDWLCALNDGIKGSNAEYTCHPGAEHGEDYPSPESVMERYNRARGLQDPQAEGYVNLHADRYAYNNSLPGCAYLRQREFLQDLRSDMRLRDIENRPLDRAWQHTVLPDFTLRGRHPFRIPAGLLPFFPARNNAGPAS